MDKQKLSVQKREVKGRKVKKLRKLGILPASLYGKKIQSISVQASLADFQKAYNQAGETGVIDLVLDGKKHPVLIKNVQIHPVSQQILHVDFYQVDLKEKVKTSVPIEFTGKAAAVVQKTGVLLTLLDNIEVEALPTDLPERATVDVSGLAEIDQVIKVENLQLPAGVAVLTGKDQEIVKVGPLVTKKAEEEAKKEEEEKAAAEAEAEEAKGKEGEGKEVKEGEKDGGLKEDKKDKGGKGEENKDGESKEKEKKQP